MLQVKIRLIINFLCLLALSLLASWKTKKIENQPTGKLKNFNLNIILTCNIYI